MSAETTLVVYGRMAVDATAGQVIRLLEAVPLVESTVETLMVVPESSCELHDFIFGLFRQLTTNRSARVLVFLDGMPAGLSAAVVNGMTLCGRIHDHLLLAGQPVPFTRLGYWLDEQNLVLPESVTERFDRINCELIKNAVTPEIYLNPDSCECRIDGIAVALSPMELLLYWLLLLRAGNKLPLLRGLNLLTEEFNAFFSSTAAYVMPEVELLRQRHGCIAEEAMGVLIEVITEKIIKSVPFEDGRFFCLPQPTHGVYGITLHYRRINCPRNY